MDNYESEKPRIKYGEDELTFSLNINDKKAEQTEKIGFEACDHTGKLKINGSQKKDSWIAGKLKLAKDDDQTPF